ncbi:hypothetical protein [Alexandriicola marinus]|nr:hypothetical protein [Alexandriicola marinus]
MTKAAPTFLNAPALASFTRAALGRVARFGIGATSLNLALAAR